MNEIIPHGFPNTGAKRSDVVNPIDTSKLIGGGVPSPVNPKPDYSHIPVYYQRQLPTCGANAGTFMSDVLNNRIGSPRSLWIRMREIDKLSPTDGSAMSTIGQALSLDGVVDLSLLPDDTTLSPESYEDPSVLTPAMKLNAITAGIDKLTIITGPFTMSQIKSLIDQHKIIKLLVECGDGWWTSKTGQNSWLSSDLFPTRLGKYTDDHYVDAYWSDGIDRCDYRNSWSDQWGDNGDGWFDSTYLPYIVQIGIPTPKTIPTQDSLQKLVNWFHTIIGK